MPGDSLNLQTAQDTDNGYSVFEQSLLRYIAAGWVSRMSSFPELRPDELLHGTGQRERVVAHFMGRRNSSHPVRRARCFCAGWKRPSFAAW